MIISRTATYVLGLIVLSVFALGPVLNAVAETVSLPAGGSHSDTVTADFGDFINYTWHGQVTGGAFTGAIRFVVIDPDGDVILNVTDSSRTGEVWSQQDGTYTFTWTNLESTSVTLVYNLDLWAIGTGNVEKALDAVILALMIGAIVVVAIIVVVIVLVVKGGERKPSAPASMTPQQYVPSGEAPSPFVPGMCPRCGSPIDSKHVFCPKCGARVR